MSDFSNFHLSDRSKIITKELPGPISRELLEEQSRLEGSIVSYPKSFPMAINRAKGAIIEDVDGNHLIDFFSSAGVVNLGHCNEEILEYTSQQQSRLIHALDYPTRLKLDVIKDILSCLPEDMADQYKVSFVGPTGADAVEAAVKLAKIKTGRDNIIAFRGGYHGMTTTALALTSNTRFRSKFKSLDANVHFIPYAYCYRCPVKKTPDTCHTDCVDYLGEVLENTFSGIVKPAAVILEPIQGEGGIVVPPPGYLEKIAQVAKENDVLTIFDEVQAGFFRSGRFLSFLHSDARPDIITMSKGLGGVGFPIAAILYKKEIEAWSTGDHVGTFRGNQVSLAGAKGAFDFVRKHNLIAHIDNISILLNGKLKALQDEFEVIGDIRGKGLMIGVEIVDDRQTKKPAPQTAKRIRDNCFQRGLIIELGGYHDNVLRLLPPLIITPDILTDAVNILHNSLKAIYEN